MVQFYFSEGVFSELKLMKNLFNQLFESKKETLEIY